MKNINKYIKEYYQKNKFLGAETFDGIVENNTIGYENRTFIREGEVKFKKKFTATNENPIMIIQYNLQGR